MAEQHSNVATNAILYRSATCRAAIRAANHSHWERVQWPPNELRAAQKVIALRSSGGVQMPAVRRRLRLFPELPDACGVQIAYLELRRIAQRQRVANRRPLVPQTGRSYGIAG